MMLWGAKAGQVYPAKPLSLSTSSCNKQLNVLMGAVAKAGVPNVLSDRE